MDVPVTQYVEVDGLSVAYQVSGDGPVDLVFVNGVFGHIEAMYELPGYGDFIEALGRFARVIAFDKRGQGMSDRLSGAPPLDERMRDIGAIMDAVGSEEAFLFGVSEGGPISVLMAALRPRRVRGLILCGTYARLTAAPDYPGLEREALLQGVRELLPRWGTPEGVPTAAAPSLASNPAFAEAMARVNRLACTPQTFLKLWELATAIDVRDILPTVTTRSLVLHRSGDQVVSVDQGRYLAAHLPNAAYHELDGPDHMPWMDADEVLGLIEEFVTGERPVTANVQRTLSSVLFTDIVSSTQLAEERGDERWRRILDDHDALCARQIKRFDGQLVKNTGDGVLATFDGPARAIACAQAIRDGALALELEIRAGLHLGEIELRGDDVGGIAVHIAARVLGQAGANEVLVTRTMRDVVVGAGFKLESRGEVTLKGIDSAWELFTVET